MQLTEKMIRERASEQSYNKGLDYYSGGAIYDPSWQPTAGGLVLMARCEGNSEFSYRLRAELEADGVYSASCTCPYDWGGDCKHIVALLLTYLNRPEEFSEQKSLADLLDGLEKESLLVLIARLVQNNPDLYDEIELALPAARLAAQPPATASAKAAGGPIAAVLPIERPQTQVSEQVYRKQVKRILKQSRYEEDYDEWGGAPAYIEDLMAVRETAVQLLDAGDAEGALIILRVLLEETGEDYDSDMDYEGDIAAFVEDLGMPLAETILSLELDEASRQALHDSVEDIHDSTGGVIDDDELEVTLAALEYGWGPLPDDETQWEEYEEEEWMIFSGLERARLNVLERQGRVEEFLQLAQSADLHRFTLKLLELGRLDEALAASRELVNNREILSVAQALHRMGRVNEAISLAERGLEQDEHYDEYNLAAWLAPLEEKLGRSEKALWAYRTAYNAHPSLETYRCLKRLAGGGWQALRPALVQRLSGQNGSDGILVDIHLEEQEWDAAIALAEKQTWGYDLLEKVAEAVIPHRPDWVIRVAFKQSDDLIAKTQSNLYPAAAQWLRRARQAYLYKGQAAEWHAYMANLRATYARRPALQRAIAGL